MNVLTFDIEEWYHGSNLNDLLTEEDWLNYPPRIDLFLPKVLDKLDEYQIKATFFCIGWMARTYPDVIKRIRQHGHEIACHTDKHLLVNKMTPESFDRDLKSALDSIQDLTGEKIISFRAPTFSISEDAAWAFQVLAENGIENDCSIFPAPRSFGGFPSFGEAAPALIKYKDCLIKELPISTANILGKPIVFGGGGYFRLFPYRIIKKLMKKSDYNMTYLHMRDFDPDQYRFKQLPLLQYFKTYYGLNRAYPKFVNMLKDFVWINVKQAINQIDFEKVKTIKLG